MSLRNLLVTAGALSLLVTSDAHAKTASTIFTSERTANARANLTSATWAQSYRDQVVNYASYWMALTDEQLWNLPVEQTVPRAIYVNKTAGCPIHGSALIDRYGVYGWKVDPVNKPYKVQCPIGGETWPTNDFAKFKASGLDSHHVFQYSIANRSLLYSTDSTRNYGVDDGTGYVASNGTHYDFIAYYNHWGVWQNLGRSWSQALVNLSEAYVLTGNTAYAHKTAILLSRIADLLPTMDTNYWSSRGYFQGDGLSGRGLALGSIWDAALGSAIARAYDAVWPALGTDTALYSFLSAKSTQYGLTPVGSRAALDKHVGDHALTVLLNAIQQRRIRANEGIHQRTYAEAAIALDDPTLTPNWLGWLEQAGDVYNGGGHVPTVLVDYVDRDGGTDDASPGYSQIWLDAIEPLAQLLEDSPYAAGHSLKRFPNFRNELGFSYWLQLLPNYYPHIGDDGTTGSPGTTPGADANRLAAAFNRYGYPELAQMAYALNGNSSAGLHGSIYDPGAQATATAVQAVVDQQGKLTRGPLMLAGYGLATLTATAGGKPAAAWVYSGRQNKHGHWDRLNLGLYAYGLDLMPDLGYPDFPTTDSPNYWGWQNNTLAHNTVVVDAKRQLTVPKGKTKAYLAGSPVQIVETDGNGVYSQAGTYQRTLTKIPAPGGGFYLIDIFRVQGGADHLYSLHGGPGSVTTRGLTLTAQSGGTYAGASVPFGSFYDGSCCTSYMGSGFQFLDTVSRAVPAGAFEAEWKVTDNWNALGGTAQDTRLKVWSAGDRASSVALANGYPPQNKPGNPASLRYLLERRTGTAPLTSTFVHVIEPYVGAPQVIAVSPFTPEPAADANGFRRVGLRIMLADGSVDTVIQGLTPASVAGNGYTFDGRGLVVRKTAAAGYAFAHLFGGTAAADATGALVAGNGVWRGTVSAVDTSDPAHVRLTLTPMPPTGTWAGRFVRVSHAGGHNPFYRIAAVSSGVVDLGRVNLVRGHVNVNDYTQGLLSDVAAGDAFEVVSDAYAAAPVPGVVAPPPPTPSDPPPTDPGPVPVTDPTPTPVTDVTPPPATTPTTTTTSTPPTKPGNRKKYKSAAVTFAQFVADGATGCATGGAIGSWVIALPIVWLWRRRRVK